VLETWVPREDPASKSPGTQGICTQPTPHGTLRDAGHDPSGDDFARQVATAHARKWQTAFVGQCTGQRLHLRMHQGGGKRQGVPCGVYLPDRRGVPARNAFAIWRRPDGAGPADLRSPYWQLPAPRGGSPWLVSPSSKERCTCVRPTPASTSHPVSAQFDRDSLVAYSAPLFRRVCHTKARSL